MKNLKSVYRLKQFMCALLVCVMTVSLLPVSAFATQTAADEPVVEHEVLPGTDEAGRKTITYKYDRLAVSATAHATGGEINDSWANIPSVHSILTYCTVVDITLEEYVSGTPVDVVCSIPQDMDSIDGAFALYTVSPSGERTRVYDYEIFFEDSLGLKASPPVFTFTMDGPGRFAFGFLRSEIPTDSKPTELKVYYNGPTSFFVQEEENEDILDEIRAGLTVVAEYTDGAGSIEKVLGEDEYTLSVDMTSEGYQTVTVTHKWNKETVNGEFAVCFCPTQILESYNDVTVATDTPGVQGVSVRKVKSPSIAIDYLLENYVAYDISLHHALGDKFNGTAAVTLPIPEGVTNPKVYYVSDDGKTITDMKAEDNGDGTVTFITDHFSVFIVGNGNSRVTVPDPAIATGKVNVTTKKDAYVLLTGRDVPAPGMQYLIVNKSNAGSGYALRENTQTGESVTVKTVNDIPYIETSDESLIWNVSDGLRFQSENDGYYLWYNNGLKFDQTYSTSWTAGTNRLYYSTRNIFGGTRNYYLRYSNGWLANTTSGNVYFYEYKKDAIATTTAVNGTFRIDGDALTKIVDGSATGTLNSTLTFIPETGDPIPTDVSTSATYTVVDNGDPNDIINNDIVGNTVRFTGNTGIALVQVTYTGKDYTVSNYILVTAQPPHYVIDITRDGKSVTKVIPVKGVTAKTKLLLGYDLTYETPNDSEPVRPAAGTISWSIPENQRHVATVATVDSETCEVTFHGVTGRVNVTVSYQTDTNTYVTDTILISANTANVSTPLDGTDDFPEYPNEGSIRFDKTASAVGTSFAETGTVQVELSLTGVPFTTNNEIDVVIMMDMSTSMKDIKAVDSAKNAAKAALEAIVKNEDGNFNNNRVAIYSFNGWSGDDTSWEKYDPIENPDDSPVEKIWDDNSSINIDQLVPFQSFSSDNDDFTRAINKLDELDNGDTGAGTNYAAALKQCYTTLAKYKPDGRQQFVIFMSDGAPSTGFAFRNDEGEKEVYYKHTTLGRSGIEGLRDRKIGQLREYYSTLMKEAGVTIYTVALRLDAFGTRYASDAKLPAATVANLAKQVLANIATPDTDGTQHAFVVDNDASGLTNVFKDIVNKILEAATDVVVQDKIADNYTMVFDVPTGGKLPVTGINKNDLCIELKNYTLDANHERTGDVEPLLKVYMGRNDNGTTATDDLTTTEDDAYYAATRADDTYYAATAPNSTNGANPWAPLQFTPEVKEKGDPRYYTDVGPKYLAREHEIVITADGTKYLFTPSGKGTHNVKSGAYAYGHVNSYLDTHYLNTSNDLIIVTPYFCYNAATKMLTWTVDAIRSTELVLSYFLHLDESSNLFTAEDGAHPTNDWATLNYKNFNNVECEQEFPIPQMTWNGAQVFYTFYLVNKDGQPVNRAGQVVDFANASFITDTFKHSVTWKENTTLDVVHEAEKLLPDNYIIYDEDASYTIHVHGPQIPKDTDFFKIEGNTNTTKVYNIPAGKKFSTPGKYEDGDPGTEGFDFASTTVAFAVLWKPRLVPDTVVLDYGLDVVIDVVANDPLQNTVSGISLSNDNYGANMNDGVSGKPKFGSNPLNLENEGFQISIESGNTIRVKQLDMHFTKPITFYYESPVEFYDDSVRYEGFMYSSVTVIPAANIYYEENFVDFVDTTDTTTSLGKWDWDPDGTMESRLQEADRPGTAAENAGAPDPDNLYGYDPAYDSFPKLSLGNAKMVTVDAASGTPDTAPEAEFTFTGTGFDIISLTSNTSGTIVVTAVNTKDNKTYRKSVDTYFGYTSNDDDKDGILTWTPNTDPEAGDTLWQVPVIKMLGLPYGTYTVTIQVAYLETLDHQAKGSYSFWLDGVRIYDPAGPDVDPLYDLYYVTGSDGTPKKAYAYSADKEKSPSYVTLRDVLVAAESLTSGVKGVGVVFVDGKAETKSDEIAIYANPGPNHETYLAKNQGVAFRLVANAAGFVFDKDDSTKIISSPTIHLGAKLAKGSSATLKLGIAVPGSTPETYQSSVSDFVTLATASDMYYDLGSKLKPSDWTPKNGSYVSAPIVLVNNSSGIISLTNLKATGGAVWNLSGTSAAALADEDITFSIMPIVDGETVEFATRTLRQLTVASKPGFGDVPSGSWYANAVDYVTGHGLMVGAGNSFLPTGQVSRAQVVQTLFSMAGKPAFTAGKSFSDVAAGSWYADAVNWAAASGVAAGSGNGTFAPDANVTREQLAMFLYAYSGAPEASADLSAFADGAKVSSWAVDAVEWAVSRHLISGKSGNLLDPQGTATRAELAQILMNFHKG